MSKGQRAFAAFVTGAGLFVSAAAAMITGGAAAHGPGNFIAKLVDMPLEPAYRTIRIVSAGEDDKSARRRHARASYAANLSQRQPVCVRLCDGYFFPSVTTPGAHDVQGAEAQCSSLCPDAPTEVYFRNGSDKIEDALSPRGERYSALPVSLRYRAKQENTCTCHREVAAASSPLRDATLRRGDAVMTPAGFVVFKGVEGGPHSVGDFTALGAASLSKDQRSTLQALERVSVLAAHPSLDRWLAAAARPSPILVTRTASKAKPIEARIRLVEASTRATN